MIAPKTINQQTESPEMRKGPGQCISVFSNTGGVGATMLAINIAESIAAQGQGSVVLVDLILQWGDISAFLDISTQYTLVNLVSESDRADSNYLRSVLAKHPSGMYILPAPNSPEESDLITASQISRTIKLLRMHFDTVVIDAGHEYNDITLTVLDESDQVVLMSLPLLPSIRNTKRNLEMFERLEYNPSKIVLVVNRYNAKGTLDKGTIEKTLGHNVHWCLPNDYETTVRMINHGTTLRALQPKGKLCGNIDQLVAKHFVKTPRPGAPTNGAGQNKVKQLFDWIKEMI